MFGSHSAGSPSRSSTARVTIPAQETSRSFGNSRTSAEQFWAVFGAAYAGFWIWLTVRIVNRQKQYAKRVAAGLIILVVAHPPVYFLLIGPLAFLEESGTIQNGVYEFAMYPVRVLADGTNLQPEWFWSICDDYLRWWFRLGNPSRL